MGYWGWKPYVSVAERRAKAQKAAAKAKKGGASLAPIAPYRGAVAKTFWGKAWCDNLERYSDFANRLPRGRTYVRNGSVIDLKISAGSVQAQVVGSSLYRVEVSVASVPDREWRAIRADCANSIDSLVELLQGRLSKAVMERICKPGVGLFPAPQAIKFSCSCPDWAVMCKHVAAVLYGVGARLDQQPELLFSLRRVDAQALVAQAGAGLASAKAGPAAAKVLADSELADVFGIEMAERAPTPAATERKRRSVKTPGTTPQAKTRGEGSSVAKQAAVKRKKPAKKSPKKVPEKPATARPPAPLPAGSRKIAGKTAKVKVAAGGAATAAQPRASTKVAAKRS
jgi:uncharacterized Zn finger protein